MGMRLIKNISPTGIKVSVTVVKPDGQNLTVDLNHGNYILVNDTGAVTKSIIIQKRKGNIDVLDGCSDGLTPYEIYSTQKEVSFSEEIDTGIIEKEEELEIKNITEEHFEPQHNIIETTTTESETVIVNPPKNKGGRPKGSFKKKGPGRPKKKKRNKSNS